MGTKIVSWLGVGVEVFSCIVRYFSLLKIVIHDVHDDDLPYKNNMFKAPVILFSNSCYTLCEGLKHKCYTFN